jgi:hypothetical protein
MDETSKQLVGEVRTPVPVAPGQPARYDSEYVRQGVRNLFMAFEPLGGQRRVKVTARRTRVDWAEFIRELVDVHYPQADVIVLVLDNLNTHTVGSLYVAFDPIEAARLVAKLEIHYTPKHGSWLNMAESELAVLAGQCLDCRIPTEEGLKEQVAAWQTDRNQQQTKTRWRFTTAEARIRLARLYPIIEDTPSPIHKTLTDH